MGDLSDPFPGDWYADADRPSSPPAWQIGRAMCFDAAKLRAPRPLHPRAVGLLRGYDHLGYLDAFGGVDGVVDVSEAAHWLTWALDRFAALMALRETPTGAEVE